jgi:glycosyltransferase involved in cell wall biosynthesis
MRLKILYIAPDVVLDLPKVLSEHFTGDYVSTWMRSDASDAKEDLARIESSFGDFRFHPRPRPVRNTLIAKVEELVFYAKKGVELSRRYGPYDAIVCYSPFRAAFAGFWVRFRTGTPLLVEFPLSPGSVYRRATSLGGRLRHFLAPRIARAVAELCDGVMILFPWQLEPLKVGPSVRRHLVHAFVRTRSDVRPSRLDDYVLLVGKPYEPKGADVLVDAFLKVRSKFPSVKLVMAGSDEDVTWLRKRAPHDAPIEYVGRLSHDDVLQLIAGCRIFALPSWTEGTPRTIIEAFALGRPVISTRIDGIPYIVRHGITGELVAPGNTDELADSLDRLLSRPEYARQLGEAGRQFSQSAFDPAAIATMWKEAVTAAVAPVGKTY